MLLLLLPPSHVHVCWMLVGIPCQYLYLRGQFFLFVCLSCPILSVAWDSTQYPLPEQTKRCGARYQPRQAMDEMAAKRNEAFRFRSDAKVRPLCPLVW